MARRKELSATMVIALRDMEDAGGEFVRFQGGYWAPANAKRGHNGVPEGHHGTSTIDSLVARGRAEYTEFKERSRGGQPFPVRVRVAPPHTEKD